MIIQSVAPSCPITSNEMYRVFGLASMKNKLQKQWNDIKENGAGRLWVGIFFLTLSTERLMQDLI